MSIKQSFVCDEFDKAASDCTNLKKLFQEAIISAAPELSCITIGYKKKLFFLGVHHPCASNFLFKRIDMPSQITFIFCTSLSKENLTASGVAPTRDNLTVAVVGTQSGRLYFIQASGVCLLDLNVSTDPIRSIFMKSTSYTRPENVVVLSDSFIMSFNIQDLQNILIASIIGLPVWSQHSSHHFIRCQRICLPTPAPHYDVSCSTSDLPTLFDQLVQASISKPNEMTSYVPPVSAVQSTWVFTGGKPFLSFSSLESATHPSGLSSFASLLYVHAKKSIFGGSGLNKDAVDVHFTDADGVPIVPSGECDHVTSSSTSSGSEKLHLNKALADQRREVLPSQMAVSSDRCWLALPDQLGRVLLVDAVKQRIVRIWKGYRDAEVAFLDAVCRQSFEDNRFQPMNSVQCGSQVTHTRCLLIHAPHRRILEAWRLTHGPRLTTWDVDEPVRLIFGQPYSLGAVTNNYPSQAFLLDSLGVVYTVEVSGELCLADSDTDAARGYEDYQVLQDCYACLSRLSDRDPVSVCTDLITLLGKFQTPTWFEGTLLHAVHHLSQAPHALINLLKDCLRLFFSPSSDERPEQRWAGSKPSEIFRLKEVTRQLLALTEYHYTFIAVNSDCVQSTNNEVITQKHTSTAECDLWSGMTETMADLLNWDLEDTRHCLQVYSFCTAILHPASHLPLPSPKQLDLSVFMDCFRVGTVINHSLETSNANFIGDGINTEHDPSNVAVQIGLSLRSDDLSGRLIKIGCLIFGPYLNGFQEFEELQDILGHGILTPDILLFALTRFLTGFECFHQLTTLICRAYRLYAYLLASFCALLVDYYTDCHSMSFGDRQLQEIDVSAGGQRFIVVLSRLHDYCLETNHLSSAYLVALVLRALLFTGWQAIEQEDDLTTSLWACCIKASPADATKREMTSDRIGPLTRHGRSSKSLISSSSLHDMVTQWHDACTQMDGLFCLGLLVQIPGSRTKTSSDQISQGQSTDEDSDEEGGPVKTVRSELEPTRDSGVNPHLIRGFPISLGRVVLCGRACITELFASWIVECRMQPEDVIGMYQGICRSSEPCLPTDTNASQTMELALPDPLFTCQPLFTMVYKRLPFTLELDTVMASVCWLCCLKWTNSSQVHIASLQMAIRFLQSLSSAGATIAQGLARMMWHGPLAPWIMQLFRPVRDDAVASGIAKSKVLKESLRMKDIGVLLMEFFAIASSACQRAEVVPIFSVEREWSVLASSQPSNNEILPCIASKFDDDYEIGFSPDGSSRSEAYYLRSIHMHPFGKPASLCQPTLSKSSRSLVAELAVNQATMTQTSVDFWQQVVIVGAALMNFGRPLKPHSNRGTAFERKAVSISQSCYEITDFFFITDTRVILRDPIDYNWEGVQTTPKLLYQEHSSLEVRRRFFISWLIERAVFTCLAILPPSQRDLVDSDRPAIRANRRNFVQAYSELQLYRQFITAASVLAKHWGFSRDMVLTQHIVSLLEANMDDQAKLYLSQVQDASNLATQVMIIIGRRVAWQCFGRSNDMSSQLRWRACIPFHLEAWLQGLLPEPYEQHPPVIGATNWQDNTSMVNLIHLMDFVMYHIPDRASQTAVAESLRDVLYAAVDS